VKEDILHISKDGLCGETSKENAKKLLLGTSAFTAGGSFPVNTDITVSPFYGKGKSLKILCF